MSVRTRFAPSPTGYLHIGGVRTALFCWLFARQHGGQFILRVDDTDQQRNVADALEPILRGLRWLGIDWDEGPEVDGPCAPYYQSQRAGRYQAAVERLLACGAAYRDYATPQEIEAERRAADRQKRLFVYSRRFMAETPQQQAYFESQGRKAAVRLKMPREGKLVLDDMVRGRVEFDWANEQDHVIQRTDGSFLYALANVVDDEDFGITHVIRAEEHLSNTPRQVFIIQALGYRLPRYAHLPFVAEPGSKNKLSKRKLNTYLKNRGFAELVERGQKILRVLGCAEPGESFNPVMVEFYQKIGFLPEALINYLALLGWSLDDRTEHFTRRELIEKFSLQRVNKAPASFDPKKLMAFQQRHMQALSAEEKAARVLPFLQAAGLTDDPDQAVWQQVLQIVKAASDRIVIAGDILDFADFFIADDKLPYDEAAFDKHLRCAQAAELLAEFRQRLATATPFDPPTLETLLHSFVEQRGIKMGQIVQALRVAVTGKAIGLGLFDTLAILGPQRCLNRLERALARL